MGPLGVQEMAVLFILALLIFGPKKLPELGKAVGKGMSEFRKASTDLRSTIKREMDNIERENLEVKEVKELAKSVREDFNPKVYDDFDYDGYDDYKYGENSTVGKSSSGSTAKEEPAAQLDAAPDAPSQPASPAKAETATAEASTDPSEAKAS